MWFASTNQLNCLATQLNLTKTEIPVDLVIFQKFDSENAVNDVITNNTGHGQFQFSYLHRDVGFTYRINRRIVRRE